MRGLIRGVMLLAILIVLIGAVGTYFAPSAPPASLSFGERQAASVYPKSMTNGQWITFAGDDGSRWEAFIQCPRPLKAGDKVHIGYSTTRGRIVTYAGRCLAPGK